MTKYLQTDTKLYSSSSHYLMTMGLMLTTSCSSDDSNANALRKKLKNLLLLQSITIVLYLAFRKNSVSLPTELGNETIKDNYTLLFIINRKKS